MDNLARPFTLVAGQPLATARDRDGSEAITGPAMRAVMMERLEQVERHGYTAAHDDMHDNGDLARGGLAYVMSGLAIAIEDPDLEDAAANQWPFSRELLRPTDDFTSYVKAAAMLIAEADRIHRARQLAAQFHQGE